jgi:hypothetical protein
MDRWIDRYTCTYVYKSSYIYIYTYVQVHRHHIPIPQDLKAVARELGENMSDEELQEMIREADKAPGGCGKSPIPEVISGL